MKFYEGNYGSHITVINANVGKTLLHNHLTNQLLQNHKETLMNAFLCQLVSFDPTVLPENLVLGYLRTQTLKGNVGQKHNKTISKSNS